MLVQVPGVMQCHWVSARDVIKIQLTTQQYLHSALLLSAKTCLPFLSVTYYTIIKNLFSMTGCMESPKPG